MPGFDVYGPPDFGREPDWLPRELAGHSAVRLSQSFIEAWRKCPRSAVAERRPTYGLAAAEGIAAHSIVDRRIAAQAANDEIDAAAAAEKVAELVGHGWTPPEGFIERATAKANVLTNLYLDLYHQYQPNIETEVSGMMIFDVRDDPRTAAEFIIITGTADLVVTIPDTDHRVGVDWKTGTTMPEPWEVQRYGVQQRVYSPMFDLDEMVFHYPLALNPLDGSKGHWVAQRYKGIVRCEADAPTRERYRQQIVEECVPISDRLLRSSDPFDHDIRPTGWHCSAKWCQVFARGECLGVHREVAWVDKSLREAGEDVNAIQTRRTT